MEIQEARNPSLVFVLEWRGILLLQGREWSTWKGIHLKLIKNVLSKENLLWGFVGRTGKFRPFAKHSTKRKCRKGDGKFYEFLGQWVGTCCLLAGAPFHRKMVLCTTIVASVSQWDSDFLLRDQRLKMMTMMIICLSSVCLCMRLSEKKRRQWNWKSPRLSAGLLFSLHPVLHPIDSQWTDKMLVWPDRSDDIGRLFIWISTNCE